MWMKVQNSTTYSSLISNGSPIQLINRKLNSQKELKFQGCSCRENLQNRARFKIRPKTKHLPKLIPTFDAIKMAINFEKEKHAQI